MKFTQYCQANNIQLLRDDKKYLVTMLRNIPENPRKSLLKRFCDEWLLGFELEENVLLKQNMGRFRANSWLRQELTSNTHKKCD